MNDLERERLQARLRSIATDRHEKQRQWSGSIEPPSEYFSQMQALDDEEQRIRAQLDSAGAAPTTAFDAIQTMWTITLGVSADLRNFRDEVRGAFARDTIARQQRQRVLDAILIVLGAGILILFVKVFL